MDAGQTTLEHPSDPRGQATVRDLDDYRALTDTDGALAVSLRMQDVLGRLRALPCLVVRAVPVVLAGQAEPAARAVNALAGSATLDSIRAVRAVVDPTATAADVAHIFSERWVGDDQRAAEAAWRERPQRTAAELPR